MSITRDHVCGFVHYCEGCKDLHYIYTKMKNNLGCRWSFNGNMEKPSVTPSVHYKAEDKDPEWPLLMVCHYILTDGVLNYCGDCTHELAGKSVPLPEIPE